MAMGPFRMGDLAGNDIGWAIRKRRYVEKPGMRYSKTADLLCELGRYGQKTGAGWYDYVPGKRDAIPSPVVVEMIANHRGELGITPRKISDDEIVHRLVYSLVNEGAKILEEGIASKASDIDMVYLTGYGFPLHRGGPMCYADHGGPVQRRADDEAFRGQPAGRRVVLAAGASAGQAGGRRQELQLIARDDQAHRSGPAGARAAAGRGAGGQHAAPGLAPGAGAAAGQAAGGRRGGGRVDGEAVRAKTVSGLLDPAGTAARVRPAARLAAQPLPAGACRHVEARGGRQPQPALHLAGQRRKGKPRSR